MTVFLSGRDATPPHAVEITGGPRAVVDALTTSLTHALGYSKGEAADRPLICLIADTEDQHPDEVVAAYVNSALVTHPRPIPLFLTARPSRFCRRGLAWEKEFVLASGKLRLDDLAARMRMLAHMWRREFPIDIVRDAVVGSFRMLMQLDEADYHHRSLLVEDLQRLAGWDGSGPPPAVRVAPDDVWQPPLDKDHAYSMLFPNAWQQIARDMKAMLALKNLDHDQTAQSHARDLANTILRKIPVSTGRFVHVLRDARPHVLIIDDEAIDIAATLRKQRVGYEQDSATLDEIFEFVAEPLSLHGNPPCPPYFDAEQWIRERIVGVARPGGTLNDLRCADLILLDLSLNQGQESELAGFILLEKLRNAIPELPLVIHTGSAALSHIIQAIRNGADWYVRKDGARTYSDLASILDDIGRRPEWTKRAKRLQRERRVSNEDELPARLQSDEFLYIWRSLAADLPEGELRVLPFSDGASGAVTCGIQVFGARENANEPEHPIASFVAKIDRPYVMLSERERFRRLVRPRIGNRAGRIDSEVVYAGRDVAGIAYTFSGIHQGRKNGSRTSLQPLSTFLDRTLDKNTFTDVAPVFDELLNDLLQTLHRSAPAGSRASWIEPLFGETATLRDSHEVRLPPLVDLELSAFSDPLPDSKGTVLTLTPGEEMHLPMCRVQRTAAGGFTVIFRDPSTGRSHRANLTGETAQFLAHFRDLRPNRALSVTGKVVRTRAAVYDAVRTAFASDVKWLDENEYPDALQDVETVLSVFDTVERETLGIIHGDLNLNNVLLDVDSSGAPVRGALWLIDFARTRRDSLAHDFAELEVDLVTRILAPSSGAAAPATIMDFQRSLDSGPLYARQHFHPSAMFVTEACQFIRRAATAAQIDKREYLASLVMYYLLVLKLHRDGGSGPAAQIRRWSLIGASAALCALETELGLRVDSGTLVRLPVRRKTDPGIGTSGVRNRPVPPLWPTR